MDITDSEREFLAAMRALTIDHEGHEVFVGLTPEESRDYLELSRQDEASGIDSVRDPERLSDLRERHEAARQEIIMGIHAPAPMKVAETGDMLPGRKKLATGSPARAESGGSSGSTSALGRGLFHETHKSPRERLVFDRYRRQRSVWMAGA